MKIDLKNSYCLFKNKEKIRITNFEIRGKGEYEKNLLSNNNVNNDFARFECELPEGKKWQDTRPFNIHPVALTEERKEAKESNVGIPKVARKESSKEERQKTTSQTTQKRKETAGKHD